MLSIVAGWLALVAPASTHCLGSSEALTLIPTGASWACRTIPAAADGPKGDPRGRSGSDLAWIDMDLDESWTTGNAGTGLAPIPQVPRFRRTIDLRRRTQLRHTFDVGADQLAKIRGLGLRVVRGDGVVVYLNGVEVYRLESSSDPHDPSPSHGVPVPPGYFYRWYFGPQQLVAGRNVLAVETHRRSIRPEDPDFDLELVGLVGDPVVWRGPYLQKGSPHSATVRFATSIPVRPVLRYGKRADRLNLRKTGPLGVEHSLVIEDLEPDTTYHYALDAASGRLPGPDGELRFHTHPPPGTDRPVRIWVIGDSGQGQFSGSETVRDAYLSYAGGDATDVWLTLGDNAYDSGSLEEYQDALFDVFPKLLSNTFLWPAIGNHDRRSFGGPTSGPYFDLFDLPVRGEAGGVPSGDERFYSFDYGNIHFVILDSQVGMIEPGSRQLQWLEEDLAKNRAEWTIAVAHVPPYTKGSHDSDTAERHVVFRGSVVPILEAHGVDLFLAGHSHTYERSFLMRGHLGASDTWDPAVHKLAPGNGCPADEFAGECDGAAGGAYVDRGTVYVVAGCSSYLGSVRKVTHPAMASAVRFLGSMVIDVEGRSLEARFLRADGKIGDRFVIRHRSAKGGLAASSVSVRAPARNPG